MKKRSNGLKRKIEQYMKKGQLSQSDEHKKLEKSFSAKSRKNFAVANLLFKISEHEDTRKILNLSADFEMYDWVIAVVYYAMYTSSLSALAKLGYKSKSHAATIAVLRRYFVKKQALEAEDIDKLAEAHALSEQLITKLIQTKIKRETAQYDATPLVTREIAKSALDDAEEFITKIEEILAGDD